VQIELEMSAREPFTLKARLSNREQRRSDLCPAIASTIEGCAA